MADTGRKMIYISKDSANLWSRAEKRAAEQGMALSPYLTRLIRNDLLGLSRPVEMTPREKLDEVLRLVEEAREQVSGTAAGDAL